MNWNGSIYHQKYKRFSPKSKQNIMSRLRSVWNSESIELQYQMIVQEYLNHLSSHRLQVEVQHEIQLTKSKQSFAFTVKDLERKRLDILQELKTVIFTFQNLQFKTQSSISKICEIISKLRHINLLYAETLINIHHYFKQHIDNQARFNKLATSFQLLHQDNDFLVKSLVRKYIVFSKSYDPFLLKHYELLKTTDNPRLKQISAIEDLFDLSANEVYRLTKAHHQIKEYLKNSSINQKFPSQQKVEGLTDCFQERSKDCQGTSVHIQRRATISYKLGNNNEQLQNYNKSIGPIFHNTPSDKKSTLETKGSIIKSQKKSCKTEPKSQQFSLPPINIMNVSKYKQSDSLRGKRKISADLHSYNRKTSPEMKKKALDRNINLLQYQEEDFKNYLIDKRLFTRQHANEDKNSSNSPQQKFRKKSFILNSYRPQKQSKIQQQMNLNYESERQQTHYNKQICNYSPKISQKNSDIITQIAIQTQSEFNSPMSTVQSYPMTQFNKNDDVKCIELMKLQASQNNQKMKYQQNIFAHLNENSQTQLPLPRVQQRSSMQLSHNFHLSQQSLIHPENHLNSKEREQKITYNSPKKQQKFSIQTKQIKVNIKNARKKSQSFSEVREQEILQKRYKLRVSQKQITVQQLFKILKQCKIKQEYRKKFEIGNWEKSIFHNQFYFHKSFINGQLQAVSLCCALPDGDLMIKYWGPLETCDQQMSNFLFGKYLQYLQKHTLLKSIYYNALQIKQLAANQFIRRKQRIFQRERVNSSLIQETSHTCFLGANFCNIAINKATPNINGILNQQNLQEFQTHKFVIFNYLLIINKLMHPGAFSAISDYHPKLKSIQQAKQIILSHYLSDSAFITDFKCDYCNLLTLKLRTPPLSAFFIADKGYIKLVGQICYEDQESLIIFVPMLKYNTKLYFGKGIKNVIRMVEKVKKSKKQKNQRIQFSIRMFRKLLRGKINCINLKEEYCFGDLQVSFVWKDHLKGKISHPMTNCQQIFDQGFYCLLELERETIFSFEVLPQNFVYQ